jgi:putative endonuclease
MCSDRRVRVGKRGEDLACGELVRRGYEVLDRRYRTRYGEIDIIARHQGVLVFVEVKARTTGRYGTGLEAVTAWKRRRLAAMASDYLARRHLENWPCRFDVVAVTLAAETGAAPLVEVISGAFTAGE